jgi:hypothetical protein
MKHIQKYRLVRKLHFVPPIGSNKKKLEVEYHQTRPWIMFKYTEKPVPWIRLLVYTGCVRPNDHIAGVLYNSSYFYQPPSFSVYRALASRYIFFILTKKAHPRDVISKVKLYDVTEGKFVGHVVIPSREKCIHYDGKGDRMPFFVRDMNTVAFYCPIRKRMAFSLTVYSSVQHFIDGELVYTLLHNGTTTISEGQFSGFHFNFALSSDAFFAFESVNSNNIYTVKLAVLRSIHKGLSIKERYTLSVGSRIDYLAENSVLGVWLARSFSSNTHFEGFEINCFARKSFHLNNDNLGLRPMHIEIQGSNKGDDNAFEVHMVAVDNEMNILQIHRKGESHGNSIYDVVNVYSRLT